MKAKQKSGKYKKKKKNPGNPNKKQFSFGMST
jgi:hypothetical protein